MTRLASGSEGTDVHDWVPSRMYLSIPLMWDVLQFTCTPDSRETPATGDLLDASLVPPKNLGHDMGEDELLEIVVASSPEITVDTRDGGQDAPSFSFRPGPTTAPTPRSTSRSMIIDEPGGFEQQTDNQTDNLTFNTTPWLYADPSQFLSLGDIAQWNEPAQGNMSDGRGASWWEEGTFNNATFN